MTRVYQPGPCRGRFSAQQVPAPRFEALTDKALLHVMEKRKLATTISDVLHILENKNQRKQHLVVALFGAVATFLLWWFHITHPAKFADAFLRGRVSVMWLALVLAPPFIMVFGFSNVVFFKPSSQPQVTGPMSGYLDQQESARKWKITVSAGVAAAANFIFMLVTAAS